MNSFLSKGLLGVIPSTTVRRHQFFGALPSLWSSSHKQMYLPFPFFLPYPPLLPPITHNFLPVELWMPVKCKKLPGASLPSAILIQLDFPPPPSTRPPKVIAAADRLKTLLGGPVQRLGWNNFCASLSFSVITTLKLPFDRKSFANTGAGPALRSDHWRS